MQPAVEQADAMTAAFPPFESARLSACLDRLTPHVRLDRIAITGGIGIQLGLATLGQPGTRERVADLDLVAASVDDIHSSICAEFLLSHYHVVRPGVPKFIVQLVDPVSRVRIDVFPDLAGSIGDARPMQIGEHRMLVLPLERILEHKIRTVSRASQSAPIDPKHVRDAFALGAVFGRLVPHVPPEFMAPDVYGVGDDCCERCELSRHPDWPLATKDRVFRLLGWTRTPAS